ncbi:hypothetical protein AB0J86_17225 [Micromonospora sp. NPDC049559]|uniref:hypothetical protein n=1 Tax=Micromonospora sp. NPDC049559 TaxID=3155923 RepID=UPI00342E73AC
MEMRVRQQAARLATVLAVLGGLVALGAAPAAADGEDKVNLRVPSSFTAGGSAGAVSVGVSKRSGGCAVVSTDLRMRLAGLAAHQVQVEYATRRQWRPVPLSGGAGGLVFTGRTTPDEPVLCERKSVTVRYRVTFLAGAPAGTLTLVGEAEAVGGGPIERDTATARLVNRNASASPSRSATASPTPVEETEAPEVPAEVAPTQAAAAVPTPPPADQGGGGLGAGAVAMGFGVALVGLGGALLVFLLRRNRRGDDPAAAEAGPIDAYRGMPINQTPVPTVYGQPAGAVPGGHAAPTVYGQRPAAQPAPTLYGQPPVAPGGDATQVVPRSGGPVPGDRTRVLPSAGAPGGGEATQVVPPGGAPGFGEATQIMPRAGAPGGGEATQVVPPGGAPRLGEATQIMPRLPD